MSIQIVTHWQTFHIDELFAITFLKMYVDNDIQITRTREKSVLEKSTADPDVWVLDVGGQYDPNMKNFDHHQADFIKSWDNKIPMSTCGIVWSYLRDNNFLSQHMNKETIAKIETDIIQKVDKEDNGIESWKEAFFIGIFNRKTDDHKKQFRQFMKALSATEDFYKNMFAIVRQAIKADKSVIKTVQKSEFYDNVIVMDSSDQAVFNRLVDFTDKHLAVMPYKGKSVWKIQSLPFKNKKYSTQCPMPEAWRGLSDKALVKVSGVDGMVFCHKTGFICVFEGTKEKAIRLAQQVYFYNQSSAL